MESKNNHTRLYVHPDFKDMIKLEAVKNRTSILKITKRIAQDAKKNNETKI